MTSLLKLWNSRHRFSSIHSGEGLGKWSEAQALRLEFQGFVKLFCILGFTSQGFGLRV